jgi:hypothetical protein
MNNEKMVLFSSRANFKTRQKVQEISVVNSQENLRLNSQIRWNIPNPEESTLVQQAYCL